MSDGKGGLLAALTRRANDFIRFALKATPVNADILLIENSADSGNKAYVTLGSLTTSVLSNVAPVEVDTTAAVVGVSSAAARSDHKHDISTAVVGATTPGNAAAEGTSASLARADHTHAISAFGSGAGNFCQGNDSRLSDDRTASGLRTATTVVSVSGATAPTVGQVLTATGASAATWQASTAGTPTVTAVTQSSATTTSSASDVLMTGMTITPAAGTYMVWFSGDFISTSTTTMTADIWVGGALVVGSERQAIQSSATQKYPFACQAKVTVNGSQAIEGRWRRPAGIMSNTNRTISIMQVL